MGGVAATVEKAVDKGNKALGGRDNSGSLLKKTAKLATRTALATATVGGSTLIEHGVKHQQAKVKRAMESVGEAPKAPDTRLMAEEANAAVAKAMDREKARALLSRGRRSTIKTSSLGLPGTAVTRVKSLLGM